MHITRVWSHTEAMLLWIEADDATTYLGRTSKAFWGHFGTNFGPIGRDPARGDKQGSSAKAEADAQCDLQLLTFEI